MIERNRTTGLIGEYAYQLRRLSPVVGSFIWQRLMSAVLRAQQQLSGVASKSEETDTSIKLPAEDRVRGLCGLAFMYLELDEFTFIQNSCMKVTSRVESDLPMPVMNDSGKWAIAELESDPFLVTRLMTEVLAFNLAGFFD